MTPDILVFADGATLGVLFMGLVAAFPLGLIVSLVSQGLDTMFQTSINELLPTA